MSEGGGSAIDAVMVDPNSIVQQYQRQQQQQSDVQRAENQRNALAEKREQELQQQRVEEQQRIKTLEKERLQVQEELKKAAEEAKQASEAVKKQAAVEEETAKRAAEEAKQAQETARRAAEEAKKQAVLAIEQAKKEVAQAEAVQKKAEAERKKVMKKAAEEKKKQEVLAKQQASEVADLFGGLASRKNAPTLEQESSSGTAGQGNKAKSGGVSQSEIDSYGSQITAAIQSKFYDYQNYVGQVCTLRIQLAPDGLLIDIKAEGGDPVLCQAAVAAARQARIPRPPSEAVYQAFKNAPVDFKPQ